MSRDVFNVNMFIFKLNEAGRAQTTATANGSISRQSWKCWLCLMWGRKSRQSVPAASHCPRGGCQGEDRARLLSGVQSKEAMGPTQHWHSIKINSLLMGSSRAVEQGHRDSVCSPPLEISTAQLDKAWTALCSFSVGSKFEIGHVLWQNYPPMATCKLNYAMILLTLLKFKIFWYMIS